MFCTFKLYLWADQTISFDKPNNIFGYSSPENFHENFWVQTSLTPTLLPVKSKILVKIFQSLRHTPTRCNNKKVTLEYSEIQKTALKPPKTCRLYVGSMQALCRLIFTKTHLNTGVSSVFMQACRLKSIFEIKFRSSGVSLSSEIRLIGIVSSVKQQSRKMQVASRWY